VIIADPDLKTSSILKDLCNSINGLNISAIVRSEPMLVAKTKNLQPDLIFLSLDSDVGGFLVMDTLKQINSNLNVIIVYPKDHDADTLVQALEAGAYECLEKPSDIQSLQYTEFRLHLLTVAGLLRSRKRFFKTRGTNHKNKFFMPPLKTDRTPKLFTHKPQVICIAASTGGPEILSQIFSILPKELDVPILLVQHIPAYMTRFFAKSLNQKSELDIVEATSGELILPSKVYIAPGGQHMVVSNPDARGRRRIRLNKKPMKNSVRPSADILFESVARSYDEHVLAIVLTGMGEDGRQGIAHLKEKTRCTCVTQEATTCVVYGMPRAIDESGMSDESLDPLSIAQKMVMSSQ